MSPIAHQELGHLLVSVCRLHHTRANQSMESIGLFRGQAFLLMALSKRDGMTHSEIAERLRISAAAATKVIKRMEQASYVQRRADPADERLSRVYLQAPGEALITEIRQGLGALDRMTFDGLPEPDLEELRRLLVHVHSNLQGIQP